MRRTYRPSNHGPIAAARAHAREPVGAFSRGSSATDELAVQLNSSPRVTQLTRTQTLLNGPGEVGHKRKRGHVDKPRKRQKRPKADDLEPVQLSTLEKAELEAYCAALAKNINDTYVGKKGRDANTFAVSVVQQKGKPSTRKLVVTSNLDNKRAPQKIKPLLDANNAEWRNNGPHLVRRKPSQSSGPKKKRVRRSDGSKHEQSQQRKTPEKKGLYERRQRPDGTPEYTPYSKRSRDNPDGESRHHAEQRMLNALEDGEEVVTIAPSRQCCAGCRGALQNQGLLDTVPSHLRGSS